MAASGEVFELTRALWLDRVANHCSVAAAVGDGRRAHAAATEYEYALGAAGHDDWSDRLVAGAAAAGPARARAAELGSAYGRLLLAVVAIQGAAEENEIAAWCALAGAAHQTLRASDPGFSFASVREDPIYDLRTPWTGTAHGTVSSWLRELGLCGEPLACEVRHAQKGEVGVPTCDADAEGPAAAIEAAAARWREGLGLAPVEHPTVEATSQMIAGDDRLSVPTSAPLRAQAEQALARGAVWPDPLVQHHWRARRGRRTSSSVWARGRYSTCRACRTSSPASWRR